jgi:hypothetical protein
MNMEKKFVALENGMKVRVQETKFDRSIGDSMNIEGIQFTVIATGTRNECIEACNVIINKLNIEIAERNRIARKKLDPIADAINKIVSKYSI